MRKHPIWLIAGSLLLIGLTVMGIRSEEGCSRCYGQLFFGVCGLIIGLKWYWDDHKSV